MPQRLVVTERSHLPRKRFAEELRRLRNERGLSLRALAKAVGWDASQFGKMESGSTLGGPEVVQALDQFYGTAPLLLTLWELAVGDLKKVREQYERYFRLEAEAVSMWQYAATAPPGLIQADGYVRETLAAGDVKGEELERRIKVRMGRRKLLEGDEAPTFRTILSESVLRMGPRDQWVWQEQLEFLTEVSERPNVTIQVLPFATGIHGLINSNTVFLMLPDGRCVAYVEHGVGGEVIEETERVERLQRGYDAARDLALSPTESRKFILRMLEEILCKPST